MACHQRRLMRSRGGNFAVPAPNWLPPDLDERMPPVEPGATCALDEVIQKLRDEWRNSCNVDRYTATESLFMNRLKMGFGLVRRTRKFDYVASIEEVKRGFFNLKNFGRAHVPGGIPDGVATLGCGSCAHFPSLQFWKFRDELRRTGAVECRIACKVHSGKEPQANTIRSFGWASRAHRTSCPEGARLDRRGELSDREAGDRHDRAPPESA